MRPIRYFMRRFRHLMQRVVDFSSLNAIVQALRNDLENKDQQLLILEKRIGEVVSRMDQQSHGLQQVVSRMDQQSHGLQHVDVLMQEVVSRLDQQSHGLQHVDVLMQEVVSRLDQQSHGLQVLSSRIRANPFKQQLLNTKSGYDGSLTMGFSGGGSGQYVDFVEIFRPTFDELVSQLSYIRNWLPDAGNAVDLGAGRGELVQIMRDQGLSSYGIDSDQSVVSAAQERGLDVRLSDIDSFLDKCSPSSLDVVTAIQVVEHVNTDQLVAWFEKIHAVLIPGGVFIAETPNPHAIDAFKAFWVDVTHVRPYYPESLLHMAQSAGFSRAEIWAPGEQHDVTDRLEFAGSYTLIATA